jgi:hypothetical protein
MLDYLDKSSSLLSRNETTFFRRLLLDRSVRKVHTSPYFLKQQRISEGGIRLLFVQNGQGCHHESSQYHQWSRNK